MDKERQEEVIKLLTAKGVTKPCPRCGNEKFELIGGTGVQLQENINSRFFSTTGRIVPVVLVSCSHCRYLTQHAQGPLGLIRHVP